MTTISSHVLDSVSGTHAGGIRVELIRIDKSGARETLIDAQTDSGGRFSESITPPRDSGDCRYELVFHSGDYIAQQNHSPAGRPILDQVVIRFAMPDTDARYHLPVMLSPCSYSVWWPGVVSRSSEAES